MANAGFWQSLNIPFTVLAPMEDVTDTVFRQLISAWGAPDVYVTEFVNVDGMCSAGRDAVIHRLRHSEIERPLVAQIWGLKPENFKTAAGDIREMGFAGIDINMGCPVKKIVKTGACSALIENPSLAEEMIIATKEGAGDLPVSVKTRIGFKKRKTLEWTGFLLEHDIAALTVHGRISKDMSDVPADWNEIKRVVGLRNEMEISTLIIGNGDIENRGQIGAFHNEYGVDGVMVGRGIFVNPLLFREDGGEYRKLSFEEKAGYLKQHIALYRETWGDKRNFNVMKKFVKVYIRGFSGASTLRGRLMDTSSYEDMQAILELSIKETGQLL
jgi:nifR3 family TIM-barrel protein